MAQADLSLGDPAVSAPLRISNSPAAGPSLQSNQVTQDVQVRGRPTLFTPFCFLINPRFLLTAACNCFGRGETCCDAQVQGPSPRHAPISSALGIAPVVVPPPRYPSSENTGAAPVNAWGKPKPQPTSSLGTNLLGTSQGMPGSRGLLSAPAPAAPAAAIPISNNNVLSVADPQVTSSGLLGSSAGTQLTGSYQQQADLKSAERVILPQQARYHFSDFWPPTRRLSPLSLWGPQPFDPSHNPPHRAATVQLPYQEGYPPRIPSSVNCKSLNFPIWGLLSVADLQT